MDATLAGDVSLDGDRAFFSFPGEPSQIGACLSLKAAGSMRFEPGKRNELRESFISSLGIDPGQVLPMRLIHSRRVYLSGEGGYAKGIDGDGILTDDHGLFPSVTVADCMPIWIFDRGTGLFGVLHSGWAGTGILSEAMSLIRRRPGYAPGGTSLILGPAIGPCCYRVPPERAVSFMDRFGPESAVHEKGAWRLDLHAANLGIAGQEKIFSVAAIRACTSCGLVFGSSRREGASGFTRMLALCGRFEAHAPKNDDT
jgi:polyphenol oxidase